MLLVALALLCVLALGCSSRVVYDQPGGEEAGVTVVRVTDGDTVKITLEIDGEDRVRLLGMDTPETDPERGSEPYGKEAARFTQRSLEDQNATLEFDVEREDDYGWLLSYAYLPDGSMFNETLLWEGYSQVATFPPNTRYLDHFEGAQREAHEVRRGLWSLPEDEFCLLTDRGNGIGGGCG